MTYNIDRSSSIPLYKQIMAILRDQILQGEYIIGELLPTERELCETFSVSRITVIRVLNELALQGFILRIQGKGSVVISQRIEEKLNSITGFSRAMREQGLSVTSKLISQESIDADDKLRRIFKLPDTYADGFVKICRLRFVDNIPAVIFTTIITQETGTALSEYNLEENSFYALYREVTGLHVVRSEVTLTSVTATPEMIQQFNVKPGTAHFQSRSVSYLANQQPIEATTALYHGDIFQFSSVLHTTEDTPHLKDPWDINAALIRERE